MEFTNCQRNRLKKCHLNLFKFTIGGLYYYRLFKNSTKICSVITFSSHPYHTEPANASHLTGFSTTQALTERYFPTDNDIIYTKKI